MKKTKEIKTAKEAKAKRAKAKTARAVSKPTPAEEQPVAETPIPTGPSLKFATVHDHATYLRKGDVINLFRKEHLVMMVNQSRALCVPMSRRIVSYETLGGQKVEFTRAEEGIAISPNSEVEIIRRGGQAEIDAFLHPKEEPKQKKEKVKKEKKPRGESKCAFIDSLLEKGGLTFTQIAKKAAEKFNANLQSTMSTVRARPAHMRAAGKTPKWIAE